MVTDWVEDPDWPKITIEPGPTPDLVTVRIRIDGVEWVPGLGGRSIIFLVETKKDPK